ncbi:hypothetical protein JXA48_01185 [Candidatus Woesearchaeota archaeon]|nr:hypothetical protein [Candidatus Woesearchaeota archaeon]
MSLETRLKRNFKFDATESHEFLFSVIITTIIIFMFSWRTTDYTFILAIRDLVLLAIISLVSLFVFVGGIKFFAIGRGYTANYNYWIGGLLGGFLISFITYGFLPIVFPGIINLKTNDRLRHGQIFIGENKVDVFWILASGLITTILFSFVLLIIYSITGFELIYYGALLNAFIGFFASLPFPNNIGLHMFYMKKKPYFFFLGMTSFVLVLVQAKNILNLLIGLGIFIILAYILKKFFLTKYKI